MSEPPWIHDHVFGQDKVRSGEGRTRLVLAITLVVMIVEIVAGIAFGSLALTADGLHMAGHGLVFGIAAYAYFIARRRATDKRLAFGAGKINALGGFAGALLLIVFAAMIALESIHRLRAPQEIQFDFAIAVAAFGLVVNAACAFILNPKNGQSSHAPSCPHAHHGGEDLNLRSAYLHVLADALTSILAIAALLAGKVFGAAWLDPVIGAVGAVIVGYWAFGLIKSSTTILLDHQAPEETQNQLRQAIEQTGDAKVVDLHMWAIGPGIYALELGIVAAQPRAPEFYRARIPHALSVVHATIEIHREPEASVRAA